MKSLLSTWRSAALIAANAFLLFALVNLAAIPAVRYRDRRAALARRDDAKLERAYPGWPLAKVHALLDERDRANVWEYEAFTEFRPKPFSGRFVNIDPKGFRKGGKDAPWPPSPPECAVFVFGGSCAFGDRLPDGATIPAALERLLPPTPACAKRTVYNFARPGYFSTQERILFEQLLVSGAAPGAAVFVDGLNEFFYDDVTGDGRLWRAGRTGELSTLVRLETASGSRERLARFLVGLPVVRLLGSLRPRPPTPPDKAYSAACDFRRLLDRWRTNRRLIEREAAASGVRPLFVWQPASCFRYDVAYHIDGGVPPTLDCVREGYKAFAAEEKSEPSPSDLLWLADVQKDRHENLYVDPVHYTEAFSREIAGSIAAALSSEP